MQTLKKPLSKLATKCKSYIQYPKPGIKPRVGYHSWKTADICKAYGIARSSLLGGGVIGILELGGGYKQSDLDQFSRMNGIPKITVVDVSVDGATNSPGSDADGEVALDIQVAAAAYFYATGKMPVIKVLWCGNSTDAFAVACQQAAANGCDVLSISWGADEAAWGQQAMQTFEAAAAAASAAGLTIFAAAGDNSAGDSDAGANVDMPSASPHVVGCGGTTKSDTAETVWGDGNLNDQGTGGGFSQQFPKPDYQTELAPGNPGRMVPDVAANADPNTGWLIVLNGREQAIGGTSAVAPFYAGLCAACGPKLGFVNPKLWSNPSVFADITQGSNGYAAQAGPDPCTGLGVPTAKLLPLLASAPVTVPPPPPPAPTQPTTYTMAVAAGGVVTFTPVKAPSDRTPIGNRSILDGIFGAGTWAKELIDKADALVKKYGESAVGVLDAVKTFVDSPSFENAETLWNEIAYLGGTKSILKAQEIKARVNWGSIATIVQVIGQLLGSLAGSGLLG